MLIVLLAALAGPTLVAAEEPVPSRQLTGIFPPDPPDAWRIVTQVGGTSDCIGDLVSPMCAVDTLFACLERHDDSLCAIAEDKPIETFYPLRKKPAGSSRILEIPGHPGPAILLSELSAEIV